MFAILYAICAAIFVARFVVISCSVTLLRLAPTVCCPIPFIHTGLSVPSFAFFSDNNKTAEEPSHVYEQSNNFIGSTIFLDCMTSLTDILRLNRAFGFFSACAWFITEMVAISSSVVPYFRIWALAYIAAQHTGKLKDPLEISQTSLFAGHLAFSAPTTNTASQRPDKIYE